ncbi:hypothetical protein HKX48_007945 [Thoreauomyces humboldtii]|nr:hypothetical protein HKX48_007945 [Thoreauomyces humboldtii]
MTSSHADDVDDLDLDDYLDDFTAPIPPAEPATAAAAAAPGASSDPTFDGDFARQLELNMAELFKESFGDSSSGDADADPSTNSEMSAAMSQLMSTFADLQQQLPTSSTSATSTSIPSTTAINTTTQSPSVPKSFQDTVAQTMSKLRSSSDQVEQQVADDARMGGAGGMSEDAMEQMMKELEGLMAGGDFDGVFGGLVEQLMSRELLYEPMKDLASKYPAWLKEHESSLSAEDLARYRQQHAYVAEILAVYDASPGPETSDEDQKRVTDLMQKMQECGNPPEEILQELAPGLQMGADGMPKLPGAAGMPGGQDCNIM